MRVRSAFGLLAAGALLAGCDHPAPVPRGVPTLAEFRPHLQSGAGTVELTKALGPRSVHYTTEAEEWDHLTWVYDLPHPDLGRQLRLEFVRYHLVYAAVGRPGAGGALAVEEVMVAERQGAAATS